MRKLLGFLSIVVLAAILGCGGGTGKVEIPKNPTSPPPIAPTKLGEKSPAGSPGK